MPFARIYVPQGALDDEQRRRIIGGVSEVINSVERRAPEKRPFTYVLITEVPAAHWGVAGEPYRRK